MSGIEQIPTEEKKYIDHILHKYLTKENNISGLFNRVVVDSADVNLYYTRQTQSYSESKGYTSFDDPVPLADGARPSLDSIGTEDASSSPTTYSSGFKVDRKLLSSKKPLIQDYIGNHTIEMANTIENYTNRTLVTDMASNAGQSYTADSEWGNSGDPVDDLLDMKADFKKACGGLDADFLAINSSNYADLAKDIRFQNTDYTNSKVVDSGKITPNPFGLTIVQDDAITEGTFFLGKKGMFADMMITEPYKVEYTKDGIAGDIWECAFTFVAQFKKPNCLMYGTGV